MLLPLTVSCFSKIQIGFTFVVPAHPGSPGQRDVKWVCVYWSYSSDVVNYIHIQQHIKWDLKKEFSVIMEQASKILWRQYWTTTTVLFPLLKAIILTLRIIHHNSAGPTNTDSHSIEKQTRGGEHLILGGDNHEIIRFFLNQSKLIPKHNENAPKLSIRNSSGKR